MEKILPTAVLLFYDYPQVFIGRSAVDQTYCCSVVAETEDGPKFLCTPISTRRREDLIGGRQDLRSIFELPETDLFFSALLGAQRDHWIPLQQEFFTTVPNDLLPKAGLFFNEFDEVASKAQELNATVSYVSLSVPEAESHTRIRSLTLAQLILRYQAAVKLLAKRLTKELKLKQKLEQLGLGLDVFGFSHGSFTVHFRSSHDGDMFGDNHAISLAFERLGDFLENTNDLASAVAFLQSVRGHTASSLIRLLELLNEHQCLFKQRWSSPRIGVSHLSTTSIEGIRLLIEACKQRDDLTEEIVILVGPVLSASVESNTWMLQSDEDNVQHRGVVADDSNMSMRGIVIETQKYRFQCRERIEVNVVSGKETTHLSAFLIEAVDA